MIFACRSCAGVRGVEELGFEPKFGFDSLSDEGSEKFMKFMETRVSSHPGLGLLERRGMMMTLVLEKQKAKKKYHAIRVLLSG